jgi:hypothetical protein
MCSHLSDNGNVITNTSALQTCSWDNLLRREGSELRISLAFRAAAHATRRVFSRRELKPRNFPYFRPPDATASQNDPSSWSTECPCPVPLREVFCWFRGSWALPSLRHRSACHSRHLPCFTAIGAAQAMRTGPLPSMRWTRPAGPTTSVTNGADGDRAYATKPSSRRRPPSSGARESQRRFGARRRPSTRCSARPCTLRRQKSG